MKILVDFPDQEGREAIPLPVKVDDAAGYLVLWVERKEGHLRMCYTVARDRESIQEYEIDRGDEMMSDLEDMARSFVSHFNRKFGDE